MQWLVTGATGFIGRHMADGLARAGHKVLAVSRSTEALKVLAEHHALITPWQLDIRAIDELTPPSPIDAVIHGAAISPADHCSDNEMIRVNVDGSRQLAAWTRKHRIAQFIHLSAVSIYGKAQGIITEESPSYHPDEYGKSKAMAETAIATARAGMPSISLRLPGVLGKGAKNVWLADVLKKMRANQLVHYFNGQALFNNAVHVDDLLPFILRLTQQPLAGHHQYVLAAASAMSFEHMLAHMKTLAASTSILIEQPATQSAFYLDCRKAIAAGYAPMTLEHMLKCYVESP